MQRAIRIQNETFSENRIDTQKLALFLRYQTTYERAFYRALNTLLKLSRDRGERSSSALAPQGAVSVRRKSAPEFVSQKLVGAMHAPVLQKTGYPAEFVSQKQPVGGPVSTKMPSCPTRPYEHDLVIPSCIKHS